MRHRVTGLPFSRSLVTAVALHLGARVTPTAAGKARAGQALTNTVVFAVALRPRATVDDRMHRPLILGLLLTCPRGRVFRLIDGLAPVIDGGLGIGPRELRSCPRTAPGANALAVEDRMDLVPSFVSRIVNPGAFHNKNVAAAAGRVWGMNLTESGVHVVRVTLIVERGDDTGDEGDERRDTQNRAGDPTQYRNRAHNSGRSS